MTSHLRSALPVFVIALVVSCGGSDDGSGPEFDTTPASVTVTPEVDTILLSSSARHTAVVANAAGQTLSAPVTWSSSNATLATVDGTGLIQALQPGIVWIYASVGSLRDSTRTYLAPVVTVSRRLPSLFAGDTTQLHGAFARLGGNPVTPADSTFWTSSNNAVATVSSAGVVTGVAPGLATIRLGSSGGRDSQVVAVLSRAPRTNRQIAFLRQVTRPADGARVPGLFVAAPDGSGEVRIGPVDGYVLEYSWSPDGGLLLVLTTQFNGVGTSALTLYFPDGSNSIPLPILGQSARVSPDLTKIVYHQGAGNDVVIMVANANGSNPRVLSTLGGANEVTPEWSPDGRRIAYRETPCNRLWVMDANGAFPRELVPSGACDLRWSPDGKEIAYMKGNGVYVVNVETAVSRPLSPNCSSDPCGAPIHSTVAWRFDGTKVAMGNDEGTGAMSIVDRDGSNPVPVDLEPGPVGMEIDTRPSWSPSGEQIAATGGVIDSTDPNATRIKIVNANGAGLVPGPLGYRVLWRP